MTLYPDSDCCRDSCCPGYTLVVGRCIPDTEDPCRLFFCYAISSTLYIGQSHITWIICFFLSPEYGLCEQQCSTYFGRVICTCFAGYNFNKVIFRLSLYYCIIKSLWISLALLDTTSTMSSCEFSITICVKNP